MFEKYRFRFEILKSISPFTIGVKKYFFLLACMTCISMATTFIVPQFYKLFVDRVIIGRELGSFFFVIAGYLGIFIVNAALSYLRLYASNRLLNRTLYKIKHRILGNYLAMPFSEIEARNTGDLKMRIDDDISKLASFGDVQTIDYAKSLITAIIAAGFILILEWRLALFSLLVIPLTFYLDHKISLKEKELQHINRKNDEGWNHWLQKSIQGWKEVKALNLQKHETRVFVRFAHNYAEYFGRWINFWVTRVLVIPKINDEFLMRFALYFFGGLLIMKEEMTIGELLIFAMYYEMLNSSIRSISSVDAELQSNMPFYNRVLKELNQSNKTVSQEMMPELASNILCMRNVSFTYGVTQSPVIENLSLDIKIGERVAIVGPSGSGKTTVLKLLTGVLKPTSGEIFFSDIHINQINEKFLFSKIGFIMQENLLLNLSIRENLLLGNPKASHSLMDEACRKACIYDFVHDQSLGYETIIGEKGVKLSGGQRQRIVLARLFLRDVDIMIFDEATSALDQYSEKIIHDAIHKIGRDKTIIVVAHRESSISLCDRAIAID